VVCLAWAEWIINPTVRTIRYRKPVLLAGRVSAHSGGGRRFQLRHYLWPVLAGKEGYVGQV
jgi:hypothetical protein